MAVGDTIPELANVTPAQCRTMAVRCAAETPLAHSNHEPPEPAESNARETSRRTSQIQALRSQRAEIIKHHRKMVRRLGQGVSLDDAARDWIHNHAASWRDRYEADQNGSDSSKTHD
ncbi:MAG: hypothetical protein MI923_29620 [Phycisphaerales bacterium]|nr:hypothetical protein [Phycisphaerales bacterium]